MRGPEQPPGAPLTPRTLPGRRRDRAARILVLMLILLGSPPCAPAVARCKDEEYLVGAECCPKCSPGYRVKQACGEYTGTVCVPCAPGTYTAHLNGLRECLSCRECSPALGLVTRRGCSPTGDTVCGCVPGHVCVPEHGDSCAQCRPHTACRPGQSVRQRGTEQQDTLCEDCPPGTFSPDGTLEQCWPHTACRPGQSVRQRGTERQDTLCEDCPPGTFSPDGTLEQCRPWTRCGWLQVEANPGTSSSDVTCSSRRLYLLLLLLLPVLGALGGLRALWVHRGRNRRPGEPPGERAPLQMRTRGAAGDPAAAHALQACPAVTTEAEEETVP